jgi:hypothetical protein
MTRTPLKKLRFERIVELRGIELDGDSSPSAGFSRAGANGSSSALPELASEPAPSGHLGSPQTNAAPDRSGLRAQLARLLGVDVDVLLAAVAHVKASREG